jgi:hypothetical protein
MRARRQGVPVETMQRALRESGLSYTEAARRLGHRRVVRGRPRGDAAPLKRKLGMLQSSCSRGYRSRVQYVNYDAATKMLRAWDLDPVDYDL